MRGGSLEERLGAFLIEHAGVDRPIVQFAEGEERGEGHAAVAAAERAVRQKSEEKRGDLFREGGIGLASECRDLRTLDGVDQAELRLHHAGMGGGAAELRADGAVQLDQILNGQIADAAAVSR